MYYADRAGHAYSGFPALGNARGRGKLTNLKTKELIRLKMTVDFLIQSI